jgi:hypothetical protein
MDRHQGWLAARLVASVEELSMESAERLGVSPADAYRHEALLHSGEAGFLAGTLPFIREGLERKEPVLVAVAAAKIDLLRSSLGPEAESVHWIDMAGIRAESGPDHPALAPVRGLPGR